MPSMHDAPLVQRWLAQSSMSEKKLHRKEKNLGFIHIRNFSLKQLSFVLYLPVSQYAPLNPAEQLHL